MRILDFYIARAVLGGAAMVMGVLLSLFVFIEFISEFDRIGQGNYTAGIALKYVIFSAPRLAYELMPLAALIGSLIGLGLLASSNELVVMRTCGISLARIAWAAVKAGLLLVVISLWLGEWVVAEAEERAASIRSTAISGASSLRTQSGFWTRDRTSFVRVTAMQGEHELAGVEIYEFEGGALRAVSLAKRALYEDGAWVLENVRRSTIDVTGVKTQRAKRVSWDLQLGPELIEVIEIKPASMSISGLYRYIRYLRANALDTAAYEVEFWVKLTLPLATGVMVFAALPFVFGPLRSVSAGQRVLVGVLVGLGLYVLNQVVAYGGLAYGIPPAVGGLLPTLLVLGASLVIMRRLP